MRSRIAGLAAWILAAPAASTLEPPAALAAEPVEPPLCVASVELDPARAVPGQQIVHRVRLLVRSDVVDVAWEEPPRFPSLRAERLHPPAPRPGVLREGASYEVRDDLRALFADGPGRIALPPARLACRAHGGGAEPTRSFATPEAILEVVPFPDSARAPGFRGVVGPLEVRAGVTPRSVSLGQSVRLVLTLRGEGNLWDASEPALSSEDLGGAEVFPRTPELLLDRGARLGVRRYFAYDLVPRREGVLRIPSFAWSWFDPATGELEVAASEAVEVAVGPRGAATGGGAPARVGLSAPSEPPASHPLGLWLALALLGAAGGIAWRLRRRRRAGARSG